MLDHHDITEKILQCAYQVSNTLGPGFVEKIYENSMLIELEREGLKAEQQKQIKVYYKGICVGEYYADLLVCDSVIVELKTVKAIEEIHCAQLINYLKATGITVGLILNFAHPKIEIRRMIYG